MSKATLVDVELSKRVGDTKVAVKLFSDRVLLSDELNMKRFQEEVSLLWALSFHPNVIGLIAFSEEPKAIVTKLYDVDLFMFLHQDVDLGTHAAYLHAGFLLFLPCSLPVLSLFPVISELFKCFLSTVLGKPFLAFQLTYFFYATRRSPHVWPHALRV